MGEKMEHDRRRGAYSKVPAMIAFDVKYTEYNDAAALNAVKKFVRKPAEQQTTKAIIINGPTFGIHYMLANSVADFVQQLITQPGR